MNFATAKVMIDEVLANRNGTRWTGSDATLCELELSVVCAQHQVALLYFLFMLAGPAIGLEDRSNSQI